MAKKHHVMRSFHQAISESFKGNRYMLFICVICVIFTIFIRWDGNFLINFYQSTSNVGTDKQEDQISVDQVTKIVIAARRFY